MLDFPLGRWVQPASITPMMMINQPPKKMWLGFFFFWGLGVVAGSLLGYWTDWIPRPMVRPSVRPSVRLPFILCVVGAIVFALIYVNILLKRNKFSLPFGLSTRHLVSGVCDSPFFHAFISFITSSFFFQCELFYELNFTQSAYSFYYFKILKLIHFCLLLGLLKLF